MSKLRHLNFFKSFVSAAALSSFTYIYSKPEQKSANTPSKEPHEHAGEQQQSLSNSSVLVLNDKISKDEQNVEASLRWILRQLPVAKEQACAGRLTALALSVRPDNDPDIFIGSSDWTDFERSQLSRSKGKTLEACLLALSQHTKGAQQSRLVCALNGISVLSDALSHCKNDNSIQLVATCLYNISRQTDCHHHLLQSKMLSKLYNWLEYGNLALSVLSATTLRNLSGKPLADGIHCVQPLRDDSMEEYEADIVFVHGLNGSAFRTWRQFDTKPRLVKEKTNSHRTVFVRHSEWDANVKQCVEEALGTQDSPFNDNNEEEHTSQCLPHTQCWPKDWLGEDMRSCRIWMVDYETYYSNWLIKCADNLKQRSLSARSSKLLENLRDAGIGSKPIVWVGHSMGGLLIKQMLLDSEAGNEDILRQTRAVLFLSTPHRGTDTLKQLGSLRYFVSPTDESKELEQNSSQLLNLQNEFKRLALSFDLHILSLGETDETPVKMGVKLKMVPHTSSDPDIGSYVLMDSNHVYICKPRSKQSPLYKLIRDFIEFSLGIQHQQTLSNEEY